MERDHIAGRLSSGRGMGGGGGLLGVGRRDVHPHILLAGVIGAAAFNELLSDLTLIFQFQTVIPVGQDELCYLI